MSGNPALRLITAVALVSSAWAQDKPSYYTPSISPYSSTPLDCGSLLCRFA